MEPDSTFRRRLVAGALLWPCGAPIAAAEGEPPHPDARGRPLRIGAATAVVDSGLAQRLRQALARDTGLASQWLRAPSADVLRAAERGEVDVALTHAPELELTLDRQGLVHDRRLLGHSEFVLAGPVAARGRERGRDPLGVKGLDVLAALRRLAEAGLQGAAPGGDAAVPPGGPAGGVLFVSAPAGTAALMREAALWKAAGLVPHGAWYRRAEGGAGDAVRAALAHRAYLLIDRPTWSAVGANSHAVLVHGDPLLVDSFHAMRSFRSPHPAAKLVMNWLSGPTGRRVLAAGGLRMAARVAGGRA